MRLTCEQMEILLSFYLENELSSCLREQVEEHLRECESCSIKYSMVKELFSDMKELLEDDVYDDFDEGFTKAHNKEDKAFSAMLSAYIDNELSDEDNIKVKKLAITNSTARKELEDSYNIRRLMSDSFKKVKSEIRNDYTKNILKQLEPDEIKAMEFHPAIKLLILFTVGAITVTAITLITLSV